MKISQVLNPIYVGEFYLDKKHDRNHINISYNSELDNKLLTSLKGRVYLFSSDGVIKKIGGSASKGGIKSTISFYTNSRHKFKSYLYCCSTNNFSSFSFNKFI